MVYEYYAQGVELLRRHGSLTAGQLRQFEAYLGRGFVPTAVENEVRAAVRQLSERAGESVSGRERERVSEVAEEQVKDSRSPDHSLTRSHSFWAGVFDADGEAPPAIEEMYRRAIGLHKREALVHGQMGVAARAGQRLKAYELAMEIMEVVRPELDGIYDAVREWQKTGKLAVRQLAVGSQEAGESVIEMMKRLKYCNERVSRIRGWLNDGYRVKTVKGEKVKVLLTAKDVQALDNERLDMLVEGKTIKEKLGI